MDSDFFLRSDYSGKVKLPKLSVSLIPMDYIIRINVNVIVHVYINIHVFSPGFRNSSALYTVYIYGIGTHISYGLNPSGEHSVHIL